MIKKFGQMAVTFIFVSCFAQTLVAQQAASGVTGAASTVQKVDGSPKSLAGKGSYLMGRQMARPLFMVSDQIDIDQFLLGIRQQLLEKKNPIKDAEVAEVMMAFNKKLQAAMTEKAEKNLKAGQDFLAKNKNTGVTVMDNGIQYKVLKQGNGPIPKETDAVKVHYVGTFPNGKEFDSSIKGGKPAEFPLNRVIPGWTKTVSRMKVGSKWRIFIPSHLGYGKRVDWPIPPNQVLVFEIELLEILK